MPFINTVQKSQAKKIRFHQYTARSTSAYIYGKTIKVNLFRTTICTDIKQTGRLFYKTVRFI